MRRKIFLLLAGILFLTSPIFAQEAARDRIYEWDDFSGGLNTQSSAFSILKNQATVAENLRFDSETKSLTKRDQILLYGTADASEAITGMHRLYLKDGTKVLLVNHGDEIEKGNDDTGVFTPILTVTSGNYRWQWTTWHDIGIGTDGYNQPVKYDGSSASATYLGSCLAIESGAGTGPAAGTYSYKVSFYTATYEVEFNVASNTITTTGNDVTLSMIPIGPDTYGGEDVVGRKIYRLESGTYKLLSGSGATGPGTITNNTTTSVTDSDTTATGAAYPTVNNTTVFADTPPKCRFVLVHNNRLWLANDPTNNPSRIYYSDDGSHDYFVTGHYFDVRANDGDSITFIKNLLGLLTVGKNNTIQKIYTEGDPDLDWAVSDPFSFIGCQAPYTAVNTPLGIIYLANDGLYKFNGQYSTLTSQNVTPVINDMTTTNFVNCWGEFNNNVYYMGYASSSSGSSINNRILKYDLLNNAYSIDLLSANAFCVFNSGTDWGVLYSGSSLTGAVYAHSVNVNEVVHTKHSDFTGTWDDARYLPVRWGGNANSPVIEIARIETINELTGTIDTLTGDINREDTDGSYISQVLDIGASSFDKLYWNETIPGSGGDVTLNIRSATDDTVCQYASWSSDYTNPAGSDISSEGTAGARRYLQYKINLSTTDIDYTPTVYDAGNYVVKLTYNKQGTSTESTIDFHWVSGWTNLGYPGYVKSLKKIYCIYESPDATGTLSIKLNALEYNQNIQKYEETNSVFNIDLINYPKYYTEYFSTGNFIGEWFNLDISESSLHALKIKKIWLVFDVESLQ